MATVHGTALQLTASSIAANMVQIVIQ